MCNPTALIAGVGLAISAVSSYASYQTQSAQFMYNAEYNNRMMMAQYEAQMAQRQAEIEYQKHAHAVEQANAMNQQKFIINNAKAANAAHDDVITQELERQDVTKAGAAQESMRIQRERKQAQAETMASSKGAGMNLDMLMRDYMRQEANYVDSVMFNANVDNRLSYWRMAESEAKAKSRTNSVKPYVGNPLPGITPWKPINPGPQQAAPSALVAGLGFGSSALGTLSQFSYRDESGKWRIW